MPFNTSRLQLFAAISSNTPIISLLRTNILLFPFGISVFLAEVVVHIGIPHISAILGPDSEQTILDRQVPIRPYEKACNRLSP